MGDVIDLKQWKQQRSQPLMTELERTDLVFIVENFFHLHHIAQPQYFDPLLPNPESVD